MDDNKELGTVLNRDGWKTWFTCCFGMDLLESVKSVASPIPHKKQVYPSMSQVDQNNMQKLAHCYFKARPSPDPEDSVYATPTAEHVSPWSQARSNRLSSMMEDSPPGVNTSGITEESNFSALAMRKKRSQQKAESPTVRPLAERSLAALTSGVADGGRGCR
ncbi:Hypothetical protein R9X50_00258500 [Acrodontium crateriforme]|uniref:Uncharacterized protein n=1 Tax=Acrodontium crateriforme TaxID=150365 RepID=A0AAQ3M2F4_9PEZI|nr:Hypothetical protein R9X50_00258500 [Acrodontium crateriforme]